MRIVPEGNETGLSAVKTALRGWFRRPGPASIPQAVSSLPSIANSAGPVTRFFLLRSSKIGSSGVSGRFTSAVARANLILRTEPGRVGRGGLGLELGERSGPLDRPAGPTERQVRVVQQFEPEGVHVLQIGAHRQLETMLRRRVPLRQERTVRHRQILLPSRRGSRRSPAGSTTHSRLVGRGGLFPGGHPVGPVGAWRCFNGRTRPRGPAGKARRGPSAPRGCRRGRSTRGCRSGRRTSCNIRHA